MLLPPGALVTMTPRALAASRSTLSTPDPARAMIFSLLAASMTSFVTLVALRTSSASASAMSLMRSCLGRPERASTVHPLTSWSSETADAGKSSEMMIFIEGARGVPADRRVAGPCERATSDMETGGGVSHRRRARRLHYNGARRTVERPREPAFRALLWCKSLDPLDSLAIAPRPGSFFNRVFHRICEHRATPRGGVT